jgi:capsular exopolysaccharide synthesis family protein
LLVCSVVVFVGGAWYVSSREVRDYSATAQVLLSQADTGQTSGHTSSQDATRYDDTQAQVAQTAAVAKMALAHTGVDMTPSRLLGSSTVTADGSADILAFTVANTNPDIAVRLVNAYAKAFTVYRRTLDTNGVKAALAGLDKHLDAVKASYNAAQKAHAIRASQRAELDRLIRQDQNLRTLLSLQTGGALFTKPATRGQQTQPKAGRNIVLGLFAGLGFGLILIAMAEALDTRVRTADEVSQTLGLRLLARIPRPAREHRAPGQMAVLQDAPGSSAETFRQLRVAFDFANLDVHATTVLVTSATEGEGKSTTAANLAIAFARTGRRVILADFDLRRPVLDQAFDLSGRPGVSDVLTGRLDVSDVLVRVAAGVIPDRPDTLDGDATFQVMPAGGGHANPSDLFESPRVSRLLDDLSALADIVLLDGPPMLPVSDAVILSGKVDAVMVVVRASLVRRSLLSEFRRVLDDAPALVLGFVFAGSDRETGYGYGYGTDSAGVSAVPSVPSAPRDRRRPAETTAANDGDLWFGRLHE